MYMVVCTILVLHTVALAFPKKEKIITDTEAMQASNALSPQTSPYLPRMSSAQIGRPDSKRASLSNKLRLT